MSLETQLRLSYYHELCDIDRNHGVKLVQHTESNRIFVMKTLKIYDLRVYRYLKDHPIEGVPLIEELIEAEDTLYVIEEYISGESLRTILDRSGPMREAAATDLICQLCRILAPLHAMDPPIVHRDIKPSNLILTRGNRLMLIDFNSAKESHAAQSRDTVLIGTAGYAAPEQYGFSASQPTADIYAIGVLFRELLTGSASGSPGGCGTMEPVIRKCLQMDPANRYQNAGALSHLLEARTLPETPEKNTRAWMSWLPPGFRSGNLLLAIPAACWYLLIIFACSYMESADSSALELFIMRVTAFILLISETLWVGNYRHVWSRLPIMRSKNLLSRIFGFTLGCFSLGASVLMIGAAIALTVAP